MQCRSLFNCYARMETKLNKVDSSIDGRSSYLKNSENYRRLLPLMIAKYKDSAEGTNNTRTLKVYTGLPSDHHAEVHCFTFSRASKTTRRITQAEFKGNLHYFYKYLLKCLSVRYRRSEMKKISHSVKYFFYRFPKMGLVARLKFPRPPS